MASTHITTKPLAFVEGDDKEFTVEDASDRSGLSKYPYEALPHDLEIPGPASLNQDSVRRGTNYFRLVELQPGEYKSALECKISTYNLEFPDFPSYEALSYTWTDSRFDLLVVGGRRVAFTDEIREKYTVCHPLWCEGKRLLISTNLRDALRRFRHTTEARLLWVDAICINQEDHAERAAQVILMPKIYHSASQVLYWLGEEDEQTTDAVNLLRLLADVGRKVMAKPEDLPTRDALLDGSASKLGLPPFPSSPWKALIRFFERPVFRRVWIIQELAVAPKILVCCGPIVDLDFRDIIDGATFVNASSWIYPMDAEYGSGTNMTTYILKAFSIKHQWIMREPGVTKGCLIQIARNFEATDPRDKVYALLGLVNDYAHRHTHDLYHGNDFSLDFLRAAGFEAERTSAGGLNIRGKASGEGAQERERGDEEHDRKYGEFFDVVDDASEILRKRDDDRIAELCDCLLKYLAVAIDLLMDIGIRYSDMQDDDGPRLSAELNLGQADLPLLETLLEQVTSSNSSLPTKREELPVNRLVTYLNGSCADVRLTAYIGPRPEIHDLIEGVVEANYADEEDLDDAESLCSFLMGIFEFLSRVESVQDSDSEEDEDSEEDVDWSDVDSEQEVTTVDSEERVIGLENRNQGRTPANHSHHPSASNPESNLDRIGQVFASAKEKEARFDEQPKKAWNAWSSDASNLIMPDYLMSVTDVYREFTVKCLQESSFADVLASIEDRSLRKIETLPSWVPDYSVSLPHQQLSSLYQSEEACSPAATKWSPSEPTVLRVQAKFIDTIRVMESTTSKGVTSDDHVKQWLQIAADPSLDGQPTIKDSLWRTLIGNCTISPTGLTYPAPEIYGQYFESLRSAVAFEKELPSDREAAEPVINAMFHDPSKQARCLSYLSWNAERDLFKEAHVKVMLGRVLFLSASQRFGMAPKSARQGDRVVLLQGVNIPYLVRAAEDGAYSLVGECYLHGIMDRDGGVRDGGEWEEMALV
ncbi:hypothetical protein MMC30_005666 [Trapelia coarctata]|nr:hypothetical protein [Trapelia coarctata]